MTRGLFRRYPGNPVLAANHWPETVNTVFKPGVTEYNGETVLLVRVEDRSGLSRLCVARSRDGYRDWVIENDRAMFPDAQRGGWWDAGKIGLGPPPLETDQGWLVCYHGVKVTAAGSIHRLGLALLDRHDSTKVLARSSEWVFGPQESYEQNGDVPDVVFPGIAVATAIMRGLLDPASPPALSRSGYPRRRTSARAACTRLFHRHDCT